MKYIVFFGFFFHFLNLMPAAAATRITQVRSIEQAKKTLEQADENTLVVFDLIDTLIRSFPTDYNPRLKPNISEPYKPQNEQDFQLSLRMIEGTRELVEPLLKSIIAKLQQKKVKVVVVTYYLAGNYGVISHIQLWRYLQLLKTGIDASVSFGKGTLNLTDLSAYRGLYPQYYNGILFTNGHTKGDALAAFLEVEHFKPKKIIAFDDNLGYLQSIQQFAEHNKTQFVGFHYVAVARSLVQQY